MQKDINVYNIIQPSPKFFLNVVEQNLPEFLIQGKHTHDSNVTNEMVMMPKSVYPALYPLY